LPLNVLRRDEAIAFLARRTGLDDQAALDRLADALGDLPLALEEAAAYLDQTQVGLEEYLELVADRARELFDLDEAAGQAHPDQRRVATIWSVSLDRVRAEVPAAEALLALCAFLAPDIPRELLREQPDVLPEQLAEAVSDPLAYNRTLAEIGRYSLASVTPTALGVHRLVQAVIRVRLGSEGEEEWTEITVGLLHELVPNDSWEVATWSACERLLPHVLAAAGHAARLHVAGEQAGRLLGRASAYLRARGQYRQALPIAEEALAVTETALGPAHVEAGWRCDELGQMLHYLGDPPGAREQFERALAISEAALSPDHPDVATWRSNLAAVLQAQGDLAGAREQFERALAIGEAALGPDHPTVAILRNNLGNVLQGLENGK
jgi:tetratricopeptide (TPR) repeat protein